MTDYVERLAKIEERHAEHEGGDCWWLLEQIRAASAALDDAGARGEPCKDSSRQLADRINDLAFDAPCRAEDMAAASDTLVALGIPDNGRSLADRIAALRAELKRLRQVEAIRVSEIEASLSRHRAAFGIADPPGVAEVHERAAKVRGEKAPISTRPNRCGGEPCISGTRLTVRAVQSFETAETAHAAYPHVTREQIEAARAYPMPTAADALDEPQASSSLTVPSEDQGPLREIIVKMTTARG